MFLEIEEGMKQSEVKKLKGLQESIGYEFQDLSLLRRALTHRSYVNESDEVTTDNQRLEFLGDAVLGLVISDDLFVRFPGFTEGPLSAMRSGLVNGASLAERARTIDLGSYMWLGLGEVMIGGTGRDSILADAYEALIAAVYLDGGFEAVQQVVLRLHKERLDVVEPEGVAPSDFKGKLQKLVVTVEDHFPTYEIVDQWGPDHHPMFRAVVTIGDKEIAKGEGHSKKAAEQAAAQHALEIFESQAK